MTIKAVNLKKFNGKLTTYTVNEKTENFKLIKERKKKSLSSRFIQLILSQTRWAQPNLYEKHNL